jgi:fused signal recognition particle receptor
MAENEKSGWFGSTLNRLKSALSRTKNQLVDEVIDEPSKSAGESTAQVQTSAPASEPREVPTAVVQQVPKPPRPIDDDYLEDLEEKLIRADIGIPTAEKIVGDLKKDAKTNGWNSRDVEQFLKKEFASMLHTTNGSQLELPEGKLTIILVVGVNGTGKTTSIGKLAWRFKQQNKKVLIAAGDTFRAAAETQLEIWAERAGVDIVRLPEGSDPGAVVFQAVKRARDESFDVLIVDTAGRLHNKKNLMDELKKVRAVIEKHASDLRLESLLVVDASIGQNGLQQARVFTEFCPLTGVILTKLDGSSKGGIVFSITRELQLPVKLIGLGEKIDDLRDFEPELFVEALFA